MSITLTCLGNAYGALGDVEKQREALERALLIKEHVYYAVTKVFVKTFVIFVDVFACSHVCLVDGFG